jgi:hypothetical protein
MLSNEMQCLLGWTNDPAPNVQPISTSKCKELKMQPLFPQFQGGYEWKGKKEHQSLGSRK